MTSGGAEAVGGEARRGARSGGGGDAGGAGGGGGGDGECEATAAADGFGSLPASSETPRARKRRSPCLSHGSGLKGLGGGIPETDL
jgi:hypothetical protein